MVEGSFLIGREECVERAVGLFGSIGRDNAETIHDTVDMGIDPYVRCVVKDTKDDFGGLDADSWECLEGGEIVWY